MIKISGIKVPAGSDTDHVRKKAAHLLRIGTDDLIDFRVLKRSKDARKHNNILDVYTVSVSVENEDRIIKKTKDRNISLMEEKIYSYPVLKYPDRKTRPVIAGFGPAGIFTALILAHSGISPLILERGKMIEERERDVRRFFDTGMLDPDSNVQFGEGGAGTFSDGKLSTGIKDRDGRKQFILDTFVRHGADRSVLTDSHPHIGTDRLLRIIPSIRREIEELGGDFLFNTKLSGLETEDGKLLRVAFSGEKDGIIDCGSLFLCLGHSARDTFFMLNDKGLQMEAKAFAVGVRAEHSRALIDRELHQEKANYKLTHRCKDGRGVYSFCMCPGGYVVNASSEEGYLTVNGMSYSARDGENSNAAIVCTVTPEDYKRHGDDPLAGVRFQRELEKKAFDECNGAVPYQRFIDFRLNRVTENFGEIKPSCMGETGYGNLRNALPSYIADDIIEAMSDFSKRINGYDADDVLFAGIEARTSSPLRIVRGEDMESVNIRGIYPVGEGAGYAGGIMSAAIDGMKAAESYINNRQGATNEGFCG